MEVLMANLRETNNSEHVAKIDPLGWLLAALVVIVTSGARMVLYNANNVTISTTVLRGAGPLG
jgi:hypothetical protein